MIRIRQGKQWKDPQAGAPITPSQPVQPMAQPVQQAGDGSTSGLYNRLVNTLTNQRPMGTGTTMPEIDQSAMAPQGKPRGYNYARTRRGY